MTWLILWRTIQEFVAILTAYGPAAALAAIATGAGG